MNTNQVEEEAKFRLMLAQFLQSNELIKSKDYQFQINPFRIYQLVCRRGGFHAVTNRKQWIQISELLQEDDHNKLKQFYHKYLLPYQKKHYFGCDTHDELPNLVLGIPRKLIKSDLPQQKMKSQQFNNLQSQIVRTLQEEQQTKNLFYLKKNKLNITKAEYKKIVMGLDQYMCRKDIIYSLNMLILYSINNHHPFLFQNYEKIFTALSNYVHNIYPPTKQQEFEDLRTITLIFRNLTMNPINLKFILGKPIFSLFVNMFNKSVDSQCSKNIVDIMNGLVKVGWDCNQILKDINNAILDDKYEDVECSIELLRGLIDERDQNVASAVTQNIKALLRVLMSYHVNIQVKEQIFEILAFVTDISSQSRQELLKNQTLINIMLGILQQMKNQQKLIQFVALTLSNISSSSTAKNYLKRYESQLMMIGFSDDSLAGIISNILTELSH